MTIVLEVIVSLLTAHQLHIQTDDGLQDEPFELCQRVSFTGTQGSESHDGVSQRFSVLIESRIHKPIIFERLSHTHDTKHVKPQ